MKYSGSSVVVTSTLPFFKKSYGQLLLSLFFCTLMLGCDSQSASTANSEGTTPSSADNVVQKDAQETSTATVEQNEDEGTSLIDAAKTNDSDKRRSSPMIAEKRDNSALQATLIGDYTGMLSCSTCDGITWNLNLHSDGSVRKTTVYTSPHTPQPPLVESGVYRQDNNMITVVYDKQNIETYSIQDNHLVRLDTNKKPDADYTLSRK